MKRMLPALLAALPGLALSGAALAGAADVSGLPPVHSVHHAGESSATAATASTTSSEGDNPNAVPGISGGAGAGGAAWPSAAQVWKRSIATPPQGRESPSTRKLAEQALAASLGTDQTLPVIGGANGLVTSLAGRPVLVCAPLHTCVIELPRGMKPVTTVGISRAEWGVQQQMVGDQPEIFVTPKFAGLHQNIVIAGTENGAPVNYGLRLVSDANRYVPFLKIASQGGLVRSWRQGSDPWSSAANPMQGGPADGESPLRGASPKTPPVLPLPNVDLDHLDLGWTIHCGGGGWFSSSDCRPIRPLKVFDDGSHTYIQMPPGLGSHGGYPILQAENTSGHLIGVDTQIRGSTYVVDSVPPEIQLRLGSEVVIIRKKG
ncbi:TrbG/VirB9 family P-type conjugative transfer protein [Acidithiobacillus sulfuriphilus]|uniref:TrbG/VirB9 family P-type conjugative transfer protein n=1 Tax=Acidithiobacillus sulfuriphilus TaxID=1867749 RepID=UPI003F5E6987